MPPSPPIMPRTLGLLISERYMGIVPLIALSKLDLSQWEVEEQYPTATPAITRPEINIARSELRSA
jgi:hypothetical protein